MTRPAHVEDAVARLRTRTGIQHGQLGADLLTVLGYLDTLEHDDGLLRADADRVQYVRTALARRVAHINRVLDGGPGDQLAAALGPAPSPRPRDAS